jgi:transposase
MTPPLGLKDLTPEQKEALILELIARINTLEAILAKDSHNSSKPPSSDGFKRQPKSLRKTKPGAVGGQPGHPGKTLKRVAHCDHTVIHPVPTRCDACGAALDRDAATVLPQGRQVLDLPLLRLTVTQHHVQGVVCRCGKAHRGQFPDAVGNAVQYGPAIRAALVYLTQYQQLPVHRTAQAMRDLFGVNLSTGTIQNCIREAGQHLEVARQAISAELQAAPVAHFDETSVRVGKSRHWLHVASTANLTWYGTHCQRGKPALDSMGILPQFKGVAVHDGWRPYADYRCNHALCNAHHLRELIFVAESTGQPWAQQMIDLLLHAKAEADVSRSQGQRSLKRQRIDDYHQRAQALVQQGLDLNPRQERHQTDQHFGRIKQTFAYNLLARLKQYTKQVWRFIADHRVPFDNNQAERDLRMPKLKQKVSGCWRTQAGLDIYCIIRSYLATIRKQARSPWSALTLAFSQNASLPL